MANYYSLSYVDDDSLGVGCTDDSLSFDLLAERKVEQTWKPIDFILEAGEFADYQPNDLGWSLCSEKLKTIIEQEASPNDFIQWLEARVISNTDKRPYFVLYLPVRFDVLDETKTIYVEGTDFVIKPYFCESKCKPHRVFSYPSAESMVIVSDQVKNAIIQKGCTGIEFLKKPLSKC